MTSGLSFRLFGVPFRAQLWFFITLVLMNIGILTFIRSDAVYKLLLFVLAMAGTAAVFLVHELGHALAYRRYGQRASVMMWGLGGFTFGETRLPPKRKILMILAGQALTIVAIVIPGFVLSFLLSPLGGGTRSLLDLPADALQVMAGFGVVWTLVNCAPILPLDAGHIVEAAVEWRTGDHSRGKTTAQLVSWVAAVILGLFVFVGLGQPFLALVLFFLAFINFMPWYQERNNLPQTVRFLPDEDEGGYYEGDSGGGSVVSMKDAKKKRDRRSPAELVTAGYEALERRDYRGALRITDRLGEKRTNAELDRWTAEVAAFAWLGDRNPVKAEEVLAALGRNVKLSQPLVATMALADKRTDEGMRLMVDSMVNEPEGGPKLIAVDLFAEYGMIHRLARELVDQPGGKGFEAAVALEGMLHRLHRTQDASTVSDVILLG